MTEEELKQMSKGGVPYSPQQQKEVEAKKEQPKLEPVKPPTEQPAMVQPMPANGKLYRKCPTCGAFQEVQQNFAYAPQQIVSQPQVNAEGLIVNHLIRPMPQDTAKQSSAPNKIQGEILDDGTPATQAKWKSSSGRVPLIPLRS